MSMPPERAAERVEELIEGILHGPGLSYVQRNPEQATHYIRQLFKLRAINLKQLHSLVAAVQEATKNCQSQMGADGQPLD